MLKSIFKNFYLLRPVLAILLFFIPLYPKFPLVSVKNTYVAIRLDDIIVAFALTAWFIHQATHRFPILKNKVLGLFLVYFSSIALTTFVAVFIYQTDPRNILLLHFLRRLEYMSLFFVALSSIPKPSDLRYPLISLVLATFLVCLYAYGQKYYSLPVISTMNEEFSKGQLLVMNIWTRVSATFAGHYDLAAFLSVSLIIIGAAFVLTPKIILRLPLLVVWLVGFHILTFTASRVSIFAFLGGIVLSLILIRRYLWTIPVTLLVLLSILNSAELNQRLLATIPSFKRQFLGLRPTPTSLPLPTPTTPALSLTPIPSVIKPQLTPIPTIVRHGPEETFPEPDIDAGVARSGEIRFNAEWPRAITAFRKNPLLGSGLGSITLATDNDYLRNLGESGLLGFISFAAILFWFTLKTLPLYFQRSPQNLHLFALVFFGCLFTTLANAVFIDVFEASKTAYLFWIMMGVYYQILDFIYDRS
jgi:hypothetical protein